MDDASLPPVTDDQITAADALAGRAQTTPAHAALMRGELETLRAQLSALRASPLSENEEPVTRFGVATPGGGDTTPGAAILRGDEASLPAYDGDPASLAFATASELAALLRAGRVTSRALTEMYLARLKAHGPGLFCVVNLVPDAVALARADQADREMASGNYRGPLHGIPYGAKDLFATRDLPTTYGAKPYEHQMLGYDAAVIEKLDGAGAVLVAKLSMGELAMDDTWFGGKTRTPWNPEAGSSGSSAGSGSAVAAGLVGFALGTETWGSIVSPCVECGTTGLRPTFGRVSRFGAMALSWSMDKIGPMTRGVEDCALVLAALAGPDARDGHSAQNVPPLSYNPAAQAETVAGLRVGLDLASVEALKADAALAPLLPVYEMAFAQIEFLTGKPLVPVELPPSNPAYDALPMVIIGVEGAASFAALMESGGLDDLAQQGPSNWPTIFRVARHVPAPDYVQCQRIRARLEKDLARALAPVDVLLTIPRVGPALAYTNLTGHPELITRCGHENGLPVSLSFVGAHWREADLLHLARAFEQATQWHGLWPRVYVRTRFPCRGRGYGRRRSNGG